MNLQEEQLNLLMQFKAKLPDSSSVNVKHLDAFSNNQKISPNQPLTNESQKKLHKLVLHKNFKSVNIKEHTFTNKLKNISDNKYCTALREIFKSVQKNIEPTEIPFSLDEDNIKLTKRIIKILNHSGVYNGEDDEAIRKSTYLPIALVNSATPKVKQGIRVIFKQDGSDIIILLIDLYHLFATERSREFYDDYKMYNHCMLELFD